MEPTKRVRKLNSRYTADALGAVLGGGSQASPAGPKEPKDTPKARVRTPKSSKPGGGSGGGGSTGGGAASSSSRKRSSSSSSSSTSKRAASGSGSTAGAAPAARGSKLQDAQDPWTPEKLATAVLHELQLNGPMTLEELDEELIDEQDEDVAAQRARLSTILAMLRCTPVVNLLTETGEPDRFIFYDCVDGPADERFYVDVPTVAEHVVREEQLLEADQRRVDLLRAAFAVCSASPPTSPPPTAVPAANDDPPAHPLRSFLEKLAEVHPTLAHDPLYEDARTATNFDEELARRAANDAPTTPIPPRH